MVDDYGRKMHVGHGFSCHVNVLRPHSRRSVALAGADPRVMPLIDPAFLDDERDLALLLKGGQIQQAIIESGPFDPLRGAMLYPTSIADPTGMIADIRARADSQWHPVGTCKMGPASDPLAVVDAALKGAGRGRAQGGRCVDHAQSRERQHQCTHNHDRRKGGRHDRRSGLIPRLGERDSGGVAGGGAP